MAATDSLGRAVSHSTVIRALLRYVEHQDPSWLPDQLFPLIEQEVMVGLPAGKKQGQAYTRTEDNIRGGIVFGGIVGARAKRVMLGRDPGGIIVTILVGIAGALLGGFLGRSLGWYGPTDAAGFLMAGAGSVVLLGLYRRVRTQPK